MSFEAESPLAESRRAGERVETNALLRVPELGHVPDAIAEHFDAVAHRLVVPSETLPMVACCLLERGTRIEIKSAMARLADGARGRFYIRERQHGWLVDRQAVYLFVVAEPNPTRDVIAMKAVPAAVVSDIIHGWNDGGDGRENFKQVSWGRIFSADEVTR